MRGGQIALPFGMQSRPAYVAMVTQPETFAVLVLRRGAGISNASLKATIFKLPFISRLHLLQTSIAAIGEGSRASFVSKRNPSRWNKISSGMSSIWIAARSWGSFGSCNEVSNRLSGFFCFEFLATFLSARGFDDREDCASGALTLFPTGAVGYGKWAGKDFLFPIAVGRSGEDKSCGAAAWLVRCRQL